MAEKKVSGKKSQETKKEPAKKLKARDKEYDDFLREYRTELRIRSRETVKETIKRTDRIRDGAAESRCGEIDPHLSQNPVSEHQILTKRTGRILSDDTGFKAMSYNQRFELKPEMPEIAEEESGEASETPDDTIPGQQTMAEIEASGGFDKILNAPVEETPEEDPDPFGSAYKKLRDSVPADMGKSEKLRAIARTAAEDAATAEAGQLSFPAFDPFFGFSDNDSDKYNPKKGKKKNKRGNKSRNTQETPFDIDESEIVTHRELTEEYSETENDTESASKKRTGLFDLLKDTQYSGQEYDPPFEINGKNEVRQALVRLKKTGRINLLKTGLLIVLGVVLLVISVVSEKADSALSPASYSLVSLIFLILAGAVCVKELLGGIKDLGKLKFTGRTGALFILASAFVQSVVALFSADTFAGEIRLIAPAAIISLTAAVIPGLLLTNNSRLAVGMLSGNKPISVFKEVSDSGIEGSVKERFAKKNGSVRYSSDTVFVTDIMKRLTNAIPKPLGGNAAYILMLMLSLLTSIGAGVIAKSFTVAVSALACMVAVSLPTAYGMSAALMLFNANNSLAEKRASLLSCRNAEKLTDTNAVIFGTSEIIEQESCSIHGIKTYGRIDPKISTLYCAAVINGADSPLRAIMKQVTDQSGEEVPEAENISCENEGGISADVEGKRVLLGTKEFLEADGVIIPRINFEEKFVTGDRKLLYLSVNGEFSMLLIVSYHIKRSVAAFFRNLSSKGIGIIIHSADPNINAVYIEKKCKLPEGSVIQTDSPKAAYFRDKESKTETALPADVFSNGSIMASALLMQKAYGLTNAVKNLPFIVYILSGLGAILTAVPMLTGNIMIVGSIYILVIKIICFMASLLVPMFASKLRK